MPYAGMRLKKQIDISTDCATSHGNNSEKAGSAEQDLRNNFLKGNYMNMNRIAKDQLIHLLYGVLFFLVIAMAAVGLDLLSAFVEKLHVTVFTSRALELTAHLMLTLDLVLFVIYLLTAARQLIKGMMKP
jgi:hypothetical protein